MKRAFLLAAAGLLVSGCYTSPNYSSGSGNEIDVYWQFSRNVLGPPAGTTLYSCAQGGVDYITVRDLSGIDYGPSTLNCTLTDTLGGAVQGIAFTNFAVGVPYTFVVTGYRNGFPTTPLFQGQSTITFTGGVNQVTVTADGLQGTLTPVFTFNSVTFLTCGDANVQRFDYILRDGSNTTIANASVNCGAGMTPGITFGLIDLDNYFLSVDAVNTTGATPVVTDSVCRSPLNHFGNDSPTIDLLPGACLNP